MPPIDPTLRKWWPTTQSMDLVEGPVSKVAAAVQAEFSRVLKGEKIAAGWFQYPDLDAALSSAPDFDNVPTFVLVLPTRSKWSVLWYNTFLCDGYSSLCWCLTSNHRLTTIHWSAHDDWTTFQSGARFNYRRHNGTEVIERSVQSAQEDKKWHFYAIGEPLEEEILSDYDIKRKRDRLNEQKLLSLLERFDARPWSTDFYAIPEQECFVVRRPNAPSTVSKRTRADVLR